MRLRAVIFDRDGVLTRFEFAPLMALLRDVPTATFQSLWTLWQAYTRACPPPKGSAAQSPYVAGFWREVSRAWGLDSALEERLNRFDYTRTIVAFDDARPALQAARGRGLRVAVLSNFPFVGLDASLGAAGLRDLVDVTIAAGVGGKPKPRPEAYLSTLAALGVDAGECVLIDDEDPCVRGAREVGIRAYRLDRAAPSATGDVLCDLTTLASVLEHVDDDHHGGEEHVAH